MSLYKKAGSPYWWIDVAPLDGPRVRISTKIRHDAPTSEQRKENLKLAKVLLHEQYTAQATARVRGAKANHISFMAYTDWYKANVTVHKRSAERERSAIKNLAAHFTTQPLHRLTKDDVLEWMATRRQAVSASTVNRELDTLKHVFSSAVPKYLPVSPIAGLARLRSPKRPMAVLSRGDEVKLMAVLEPRERLIVMTALDTLIRAGDLLKLTTHDDKGTHFTIDNPKGGRPYKVPISHRLRKALDANPHATTLLFPDTTVMDLQRMLQRGCVNAGITYGRAHHGITFHSLRHTGATRLAESGVSLRVLQELGAWSDLRLLTNYTHPSDAALKAAVEVIGQNVPSRVTRKGRQVKPDASSRDIARTRLPAKRA